ncbi:dihydroflavonol-4-reductase, partial [Hortaea werneckii]
YDVVAVVRSADKARHLEDQYPAGKVSHAVVADITADGAFDRAVQSDPPFDAVIHAASPFHFHSKEFQSDILDPAVKGTTGILKSVKAHAPGVRRVVVTSSMAAVLDLKNPPDLYDETAWNPVSLEEAQSGPILAYMGSKTFAERAARDFVSREKPSFDLVTIHPPGVCGPPIHKLESLDAVNTSNHVFAGLLQGEWQGAVPDSPLSQWVDVRDIALAHVRAIELPQASNRRILIVAGYTSNEQVATIVARGFPALRGKLPSNFGKTTSTKVSKVDPQFAKSELRIVFTSLEASVTDTIEALLPLIKY